MATTGYKDFNLMNPSSTSSTNLVLRVNYSYVQDAVNNRTTVTVESIQIKSNNFYLTTFTGNGRIKVGSLNIDYSNSGSADQTYISAQNQFYNFGSGKAGGSFIVNHNSSGAGSFTIQITYNPSTYSDGDTTNFWVYCEYDWHGNGRNSGSATVSLPTIDRSAPTVSLSASAASSSSISISASANANCDIWQYKIDSGSWTQFSTTSGTSASTTVTGLSSTSHTVQVRARKASNNVYGTSAGKTVDCVAPTVTFSVSDITVSGFKISASSNVKCNLWQYKIGSGSWTQFSTTDGTSASVSITGRDPNTSYSVQVRARKTSNSLYGTASAQNVKTLGSSLLNSATGFAIDVASPSAAINVTVYGTFYHKLHFYKSDGTTLITTRNIGSYSACTDTAKTVSLTSANRTALLNQIPSAKTLTVKVALETFTDSGYTNSIGVSTKREITLTTSATVSAPTFTAFTYRDTETVVTGVTGNDQILVQNFSHLVVTASAGTAKNGASISGYSVSIGDVSLTDTSTTLDVGAVASSGSLALSVTCTDSRGYSTTVTKTVTVLAYSAPRLTTYSLRRRNEIDALAQLVFSGMVSSVTVSGTEKNAVSTISVRYKKTSESSWTTINLKSAATISGLYFSYSNLELVELDANYSFDFELTITDKFGTLTKLAYTDILNQGTPLLAFRKRTSTLPPRVGVNNPSPVAPLDVSGDIHMNGYRVMGFVKKLDNSGTDLNAITEPGWFTQYAGANASTALNYPAATAGYLEVIRMPNGRVLQRYTKWDCTAIYMRHKGTGSTWSAWTSIMSAVLPYSTATATISENITTSGSPAVSLQRCGKTVICTVSINMTSGLTANVYKILATVPSEYSPKERTTAIGKVAAGNAAIFAVSTNGDIQVAADATVASGTTAYVRGTLMWFTA